MKNIFWIALFLISLHAKAGSCTANGTGNWETPATWSCGHIPTTGDNVTIGTGFTVTVTGNNTVEIGNLNILGTLKFTNGSKVGLGATSVVNVYSGGSITGGNGGAKLVFPSTSFSGSFATTGPYYFSNGGSGTGVLPLTLISFNVSQQNQDVTLQWTTDLDEDIRSFEIEFATGETSDWQSIGTVFSFTNNNTYSFVDRNALNGDRYYRLKIVGKDGQYMYSKVLHTNFNISGTFSISPTLVNSSIRVVLPASGQFQILIFNPYGQLVKTTKNTGETFNMDVSGLHRGEYFIKAFQGQTSYTAKFVKQ